MSLIEIRNVVLLFSNPVWNGATTIPNTIIRNITALSSQLAYEETITQNLTTLTTEHAETLNGVIQGLLYVPDIPAADECSVLQTDYLPVNVTRQANLPPTNYRLIALAPWFNVACTQAYLAAARSDPLRAFVFYRPNNSGNKPQDVDAPIWDLHDGGRWRTENLFPIFAVSSTQGAEMMEQLGRYSGSLADVPFGDEISELYGPNPRDYVRIWTELTISRPSDLPAMWTYFVIVVAVLIAIIISVSITMHLIQRRRRQSLQRRVESGEVDLEAMGIKKMTVPPKHAGGFPLFTYVDASKARKGRRDEGAGQGTGASDLSRPPSSTHGTVGPDGSLRRGDRAPSVQSRSTVRRTKSVVATNHQPRCHICLEAFREHVTIIRQLTCGHIFHQRCIDEFLANNSSLCPICKQCMLPPGHCPKITNGMVRRERAMRQLRSRVLLDEAGADDGPSPRRFRFFFPSFSRPIVSLATLSGRKSPNTLRTDTISGAVTPSPYTETAAQHSESTPPSATPGLVEDPRTSPSFGSLSAPPRPGPTDHMGEEPSGADSTAQRDQSAVARGTDLGSVPEGELILGGELRSEPGGELRSEPGGELRGEPGGETERLPGLRGRNSPSSLARRRMRELADQFDDSDQEPMWRRAISKIFPGIP